MFAKEIIFIYNQFTMIRLNKYLAQSGVASRRKCDELILEGKVRVNDKVVTTLGVLVDEKTDKVEFDTQVVKNDVQLKYIKMNKPKGYICSAKDDKGRKTVYDLIKKEEGRLFTIGRLDYDTEGLLIFTNDGVLADKLAHPRNEVKKIYVAKIEGTLKESEYAVLRAGVVLKDETLPPAKIEFKGNGKGYTKVQITIKEGQNHQIKKMFEGIGRRLLLLKRVQIGEIKLGGLSRGEYKHLTDFEKETFKWL